MMLAPDLRERVAELEDLGFDAIPLRPGSKRPLCDDWQHKAPGVQWQDAPGDCNIGLRAGGALPFAVLDCDAPDTAQVVQRILAGMGYYADGYPLIRTASGEGRHVYVRMAQPITDGHSYHLLKRDVGKGEFRYGPGSQVVGVGSRVDGREYTLEAGDLRQLPAFDLADARLFVDLDAAPESRAGGKTAPDVTAAPKLARYAQALLVGDPDAIGRYRTRSEADAALLTDLIRKGCSWDAVLMLYLSKPTTGKFSELWQSKGERAAVGWLRHSYDTIKERSRTWESPGRKLALAVQRCELAQPTPKGLQAKFTRDVLLACADIAAQAGAGEFAAPVRRVAEGAGVHYNTVTKHLHRLVSAGRLEILKAATGNYGAVYRLAPVPDVVTQPGNAPSEDGKKPHACDTSSHSLCEEVSHGCGFLAADRTQIDAKSDTSSQRIREEVSDFASKHAGDVWRTRGLGKTAQAIYGTLRVHPDLTAPEIAKLAGCSDDTARRLLNKMSGCYVDAKTGAECRLVDPLTGEVIRLVIQAGRRWQAVEVADWQAVARAVGTDGAGERQRQGHERERQSRQRAFVRAREGTTPEGEAVTASRKELRRSHRLIEALRNATPDVPASGEAGPHVSDLLRGPGRVM